jgi:hypothetical protein
MRRDLKPDAQAFDRIIIDTVPRWKDSEMSGSEWRISASIKFYRKGILVHESFASDVQHASYLVGARYIEACDNALGYFAGEGVLCDQEGCSETATIKLKKKFDYCREGHRSIEPSNAYRMFCEKHKTRGNCGLDDADINYEEMK